MCIVRVCVRNVYACARDEFPFQCLARSRRDLVVVVESPRSPKAEEQLIGRSDRKKRRGARVRRRFRAHSASRISTLPFSPVVLSFFPFPRVSLFFTFVRTNSATRVELLEREALASPRRRIDLSSAPSSRRECLRECGREKEVVPFSRELLLAVWNKSRQVRQAWNRRERPSSKDNGRARRRVAQETREYPENF